MEKFIENLLEILEEEDVSLNDELESFEAWDSLAILSIIALADEIYGVSLFADEVEKATTVGGLQKLISEKK